VALTVEELLARTAYRESDVDRLLDPEHPSFLRFDPYLGYVFIDFVMRDGVDHSLSSYVYDKEIGHRKLMHYGDQPCRINTYGDSFTQGQQVSDAETWQEVLSAHIREPIRNFGVGGYSVYQAYRRAKIIEATEASAEYVILNIWDDDHIRNLDLSRWIRTAWDSRDKPWSGGDAPWPIHGWPWGHIRYDLDANRFVELDGFCRDEEDVRKLGDSDHFYQCFKDDDIVHLFVLRNGGDAPTERLEATAEALGIAVDLRDSAKRAEDAARLHVQYGLKSTTFMLDGMREWAAGLGKKLMVLLSYNAPTIAEFVAHDRRFDRDLVEYLEKSNVAHVDCLKKSAEDYQSYSLSMDEYLKRFYIAAAGAAVFGHYNPYGNHWFAFALKNEIVDWLDPKPPAYRDNEVSF